MYIIFNKQRKGYISDIIFTTSVEAERWLLKYEHIRLTNKLNYYEIHKTKRVVSIQETKEFKVILD